MKGQILIFLSLLMLLTPLGLSAQEENYRPYGKLEKPWIEPFIQGIPLYTRTDTSSIIFIGDVMMHAKQLKYNHDTFLEGIRTRLENATLAVANMEFTLAGEPYSGYPQFSAPDSYAEYVANCGVDVFLTANNHILDKGKSGIDRTIEVYRGMENILFTGIAEDEEADIESYPLIVMVGGVRVALINFTYGTNLSIPTKWPKVNRMDKKDISAAIERAKEAKSDIIIALPHWGEEYQLEHNDRQEEMAQWLAEQGADYIIGAHPHVVQDSTTIKTSTGKNVPTVYSMGNAVSNMSAINTRLELAVTVKFTHDQHGNIELLTPQIEFLWCTLPGTLTDSYMTIAVKDYTGRGDLWKQPSDYENMISTYERVKNTTGIKD